MKKIVFILILAATFFSCKKNGDSPSNTMKATVNGTAVEFTIQSATLLRSTDANQKRLDFTGLSKDGTMLITLTIGEETSEGNGVTKGDHLVRLFNDDDPNTSEDESIDSDAFITVTIKDGNNTITDVASENGNINVSGVDETNNVVSGTFTAVLQSLTGGTDYTITGGSFSGVKYTVVN